MDPTTYLRRSLSVLAGTGLVLSLVACGSSNPDPIPPAPQSETSSAPETTPSSTATDDADGAPVGWEDEFSDRQLRAYETALARSDRYRRGSEPIYAKGKNTPAARKFFKSRDLRWRQQIAILDAMEQAGLRAVRPPDPLWSMAKSVKLQRDGTGTVLISQCTDYTDMRWERRGKPEKGLMPKLRITPLTIRMEKRDVQGNWMLANSQIKGERSCAG